MSEYFRKPIVKILMLKGQEGQSIKSIEKTSTSGLVETYTITLTDGTTSTFSVANGKGISSISKTGTSGLVDTYTITFNDGTESTFTVKNGENGDKAEIEKINKALETNTSNITKNTTSIANLNNATRINLLRPTLQTQTLNGVTCKNNGDGTYTLSGTSTSTTVFTIQILDISSGMKRLVGCPSGGSSTSYKLEIQYYQVDFGDGGNNKSSLKNANLRIIVYSGVTCDNLVFKPMLTTNLNATYDDFVSYEDSIATNRIIATNSVTLGTSWTQETTNGYYTQTVALSGITSNDNPTIDVVLSGTLENMQSQQEEWGKILKVETSANSLKFYASEPTTVSLSVIVKGV